MNFEEEEFAVRNMYGWHGYGLSTMENVINMKLSIVLDIVSGSCLSKITLRF